MEYILYDDRLEISTGIMFYTEIVINIRKAIKVEYDLDNIRCNKYGGVSINFTKDKKLTDNDANIICNIIFDTIENVYTKLKKEETKDVLEGTGFTWGVPH